MGEKQGLLEVLLGVVLSSANDAICVPGMAPKDGRCGKLPAELDLCQESHGLANPHGTAFHSTVASPLLPETRSAYYSLLLELLFASQGA